jgi:hypothetical protein
MLCSFVAFFLYQSNTIRLLVPAKSSWPTTSVLWTAGFGRYCRLGLLQGGLKPFVRREGSNGCGVGIGRGFASVGATSTPKVRQVVVNRLSILIPWPTSVRRFWEVGLGVGGAHSGVKAFFGCESPSGDFRPDCRVF